MDKVSFLSDVLVDKSGKTRKFVLDDKLYKQFKFIVGYRYKTLEKTFGNIKDTNMKIEEKFNNICNILNPEFDKSNKVKSNGLNSLKNIDQLKLPPTLPISKNMQIIGRMSTIEKATKYNSTRFKALNLPPNQDFEWTRDINDAYIMCAYMDSLKNQNIDNEFARNFSLVLVVDKNTPYKKVIDKAQINTNLSIEKEEKTNYNCDKECIFPPSIHYTNDTPSQCKLVDDKKTCYSQIPSVTFTEIILLTSYFNMDCYYLSGNELYDLYFFAIKNGKTNKMEPAYLRFNSNSKDKKIQLSLVKILSETKYAKSKYLKYKNKYLALKKKMHEENNTK